MYQIATMSQSTIVSAAAAGEPAMVFAKAPIRSPAMAVEPQWIDYNGHLNVAWYQVFFCRAIEGVFALLGIGEEYYAQTNSSMFVLESHTSYLREIKDGDRIIVDTQILDSDSKRIHLFQTLIHAEDSFISATNESMQMHIDMTKRRAAPFRAEQIARLAACTAAHADLRTPEQAGRSVGIRRRQVE